MHCVYCGRPADPAIGGLSKCMKCTVTKLVVGVVILAAALASVWGQHR